MTTSLITKLDQIEDFRRKEGRRHSLSLIIMLIIMAGISQTFSGQGITAFIERHRKELIKKLNIPKDRLPSRSPIRAALKNLDFDKLAAIFKEWLVENGLIEEDEWISLDGKSIKSTLSGSNSKDENFVSVVSAFAHSAHVVLLSKNFESKKTSEIEIVEWLINALGLQGVTFTLDALHTKKNS